MSSVTTARALTSLLLAVPSAVSLPAQKPRRSPVHSDSTRALAATPSDPALRALHWRLVGPFRGGRVVAVAGDPVHPLTFYFGAVDGGVWKTTNGGETWRNVSDGTSDIASVGAIAVAPSDPNLTPAGYYMLFLLDGNGVPSVAKIVRIYAGSGPPSAPTGLTAIALSTNQIALSWNASSGATSYNAKRATNSGGPYTTVANPSTTNYTDTGLANTTTYYYVVSALNGGGESTNSTQVSARPTSSASVAMNAANTAGQLQISWPTDHTGWQLQSQTNNLTSGLGTNWVNEPASMHTNQMTVPLNSTNGSVFFRLVRPY